MDEHFDINGGGKRGGPFTHTPLACEQKTLTLVKENARFCGAEWTMPLPPSPPNASFLDCESLRKWLSLFWAEKFKIWSFLTKHFWFYFRQVFLQFCLEADVSPSPPGPWEGVRHPPSQLEFRDSAPKFVLFRCLSPCHILLRSAVHQGEVVVSEQPKPWVIPTWGQLLPASIYPVCCDKGKKLSSDRSQRSDKEWWFVTFRQWRCFN